MNPAMRENFGEAQKACFIFQRRGKNSSVCNAEIVLNRETSFKMTKENTNTSNNTV